MVTSEPRHKVLVVEDDADIREGLIDVLEENGCAAVGAANGQQALLYLKNAKTFPCLILLDLVTPVMDGSSFREAQLRDSLLARIPVVVVSACQNEEDIANIAKRLKGAHFLRKPPQIDHLMAAIAAYCERD
jgi:CheY-like chemotaxis protein